MKKNLLYPGTFDPITYGHIDLIKKALKIVDTVIVAISENSNKKYLFEASERLEIVKNALFKDLNFSKKRVKIITFNSLTTSLCKKLKSNIIFIIKEIIQFQLNTTNILVEIIYGLCHLSKGKMLQNWYGIFYLDMT